MMNRHSDISCSGRYFFDDGLRFGCQRCGLCCTGSPGVVRISISEIRLLAAYLKMTVEETIHRHLRTISDGFSIQEENDGRCRFYRNGCQVYAVRPLQCRTFPFWLNHLRSLSRWKKVAGECPGIGEGRLFSRDEILRFLYESLDQFEFI